MRPPGPPDRGTGRGSGPIARRLVVVMGVSGVGKTAVGQALAERLGVEYADADDLHPPANVEKMRGGTPLTDEDRLPWLRRVGHWLGEHASSGGVVSCSALKRAYREVVLEGAPTAYFLHLTVPEQVLRQRMTQRTHFMPPALLASQLETLEPLAPEEPGIEVDGSQSVRAVVEEYVARTAWDD